MKIAHLYDFDPINITDDEPETLVIENNRLFREMLLELLEQIDYDSGNFVLSENNDPISISKSVLFITDLFSNPFEGKQIRAKINQKILSDFEDDSTGATISKINQLASQICQGSEYPLSYNMSITFSDIIKMLDFQIDTDNMSDLEFIFECIRIPYELLDKKLVIIVGLKDILIEQEYLGKHQRFPL